MPEYILFYSKLKDSRVSMDQEFFATQKEAVQWLQKAKLSDPSIDCKFLFIGDRVPISVEVEHFDPVVRVEIDNQ